MEQDLLLKGLRRTTRRNYLLYCKKFAALFVRSPELKEAPLASQLSLEGSVAPVADRPAVER